MDRGDVVTEILSPPATRTVYERPPGLSNTQGRKRTCASEFRMKLTASLLMGLKNIAAGNPSAYLVEHRIIIRVQCNAATVVVLQRARVASARW